MLSGVGWWTLKLLGGLAVQSALLACVYWALVLYDRLRGR
jgi:hypothetical protein